MILNQPVIRRALEEEVKRRVLELEEKVKRFSKKLSRIGDEEVASLIREDREKR